ncbi:carbon starvation protein A, partial [Peptococcaceae bacterium]|nr:carbon starvation protein A [Peptococcaceae bacterium]
LASTGRDNKATKIPMVFVFIVTFIALIQLIINNFSAGNILLGVLGCLLLLLALVLIYQAYKAMNGIKRNSVLK